MISGSIVPEYISCLKLSALKPRPTENGIPETTSPLIALIDAEGLGESNGMICVLKSYEEHKYGTIHEEDALLATYRSINGTMIPSSSFDLNDYFYFYHVVEKRGFAPAGRALSIPKSRLSRHVQQLESRLDARLIQRSSRQFELTDIGQEFFNHAKAVVEKVYAAEASVEHRKQELSGKIRISCSPGVAQFALERLIADFIKRHPKVEIGQQVTNELVSLIEARIDLAIRGHAQTLEDSSLIQKKVANVEWNLFASPNYLEELGTPETPTDLKSHRGMCLGWNKDFAEWKLRSNSGEAAKTQFVPRLSSDDMVTLRNACSAGVGIVSLPSYVCKPEVAAGRLMRVLPRWSSGSATLSLLQPTRRGVLPAVTVFAEHIGDNLPKVVAA